MTTAKADTTAPKAKDDLDQLIQKSLAPGEKVLVVDVAKKQSRKRIKNLRKGRGGLFDKVMETLGELRAEGAISATTPPVVIVVRERAKDRGFFRF